MDQAIRAWGEKTADPYEAGLADLYRRNYPLASAQLKESLNSRENKLSLDQKEVADASFFLGQSLYLEGKYRESAQAFRRSLQFRPNEATVVCSLGVTLTQAGDYDAAEKLLRQALDTYEKKPSQDNIQIANFLSNLGCY